MKSNDQNMYSDLFKQEHSKLISNLVRILGPHNFDQAENIVQETLIKATQIWPLQGLPDKPVAWLTTVAKNLALDHLKRARFVEYNSEHKIFSHVQKFLNTFSFVQ